MYTAPEFPPPKSHRANRRYSKEECAQAAPVEHAHCAALPSGANSSRNGVTILVHTLSCLGSEARISQESGECAALEERKHDLLGRHHN
jgi:hypothetical protein